MKQLLTQCYLALVLALSGGFCAVITRAAMNKKSINWFQAIAQLISAVFSGFLIHCICCQFQATQPGTHMYCMFVAMAGYASKPLLTIIRQTILFRIKNMLTGGPLQK